MVAHPGVVFPPPTHSAREAAPAESGSFVKGLFTALGVLAVLLALVIAPEIVRPVPEIVARPEDVTSRVAELL